MKMTINKAPFVEAYKQVNRSNLQQPPTVIAHRIVLETDYLDDNCVPVLKAVQNVAKGQEEAAIPSFIGQLALKLPGHELLGELDLHDRHLAKLTMSKLIIEIMTHNGYLQVQNEVRSFLRNGRRVHVEVPYIACGGEKQQRPLDMGLSRKPQCNQRYVNGRKMSGDMKRYLKSKSNQRFMVSTYCTEENVRMGFALSKAYQFVEKTLKERNAKKERYEARVKFATSLVGQKFHLPMRFDDRLREYYEFQTDGLKPQGKLWETLMWDSERAEVITEDGAWAIKHMIYCKLHGKWTMEFVKDNWSKLDYEDARDKDPFDAKDDDEFGEFLLLNKLADALDFYARGEPCNYLFGIDLTNSGLIMASCLFKSIQMASSCNLAGDCSKVADSHTAFKEAYGLDISRNDIKPIHTALLHGGSVYTLQKQLAGLGKDVQLDDIDEYNRNAYGDCVSNIEVLATWGKELMDNYRSSVSWKTPDGFVAHHKAFIESVPVSVRCVTPGAKKLWCESSVVTDTPLKYHADGELAYGYGFGEGFSSKAGTRPHIRGLYANIIHSFDAYCLREVSKVFDEQRLPLLSKHDDYMVHPNNMATVQNILRRVFDEIQKSDYMDRVLEDIVSSGNYKKPELVYGEWDSGINNSNFLMA